MPDVESLRKLHIPQTPGAIDRHGLLAQLRGALDHKLTVISAPPGYGKTTAVSQLAKRVPCPVIWHTVEERERDVPNLYAHALSAVEQIAPGLTTAAETRDYTPAELAAFFADHLRDAASEPFAYVLDDAQHLAGSLAAEAWLRRLVTLLPSNCHLILVSRVLPRLPYAEMLARSEVLAFGQRELRFSTEEAIQLASQMLGSSLPDANIAGLVERLEGWPAGIVLALQPLPADLERAMLGGSGGPEALFNQLAVSMLNAQSPALRDFLLASSTLRRLTPEMCTSALGLHDSAARLAEAQARNLFLSKVSGGLVYHQLFRGFLQEQLRALEPARFLDLHAQAARWLEAEGDVEEAFEHYIDAGMHPRAAALAERVAAAYFSQGKTETLLNWSQRLRPLGAPAPRLAYMCARVHIDRYNYEAATAELDAAEAQFRRLDDAVGIGDVQLQRVMIMLQRGEYQQAAAQAGELVRVLPDVANLRGRALRNLGVALVFLGDVESGKECLEEALPLYRMDGDISALSHLLQDLQIAYDRLGHLDQVGACLQEYVALRRELGGAGALALALNNMGYYYYQRGDYDRAYSTFQEGMQAVARVSDRRAESYLLWSLGDLQRDVHNYVEALRLYDRALELHGSSEPLLRVSLLISTSTMRRWMGAHEEALALAQEAAEIAEEHAMPREDLIARAALWAALARMGQVTEAAEALGELAAALARQGARYELIGLHAVQASIALERGDRPAAERSLDAALALAEEVGSRQPLAVETSHDQVLEAFVLAHPHRYAPLLADLERLREAQQRMGETAQAADLLPGGTTYSLRVWTLGEERVEQDGRHISVQDWRATAARELFFYLLFNSPKTREEICLAFWPDSPAQRVRSNFHTTLYRARQALGEDVIVYIIETDRYKINPQLRLWCDAFQLEALAREARLLPPRDARAEDLWRKAAALYRGEFLISSEMDWVYPRREALRELYLEALLGLSECARSRGDYREALQTLRLALDVDPFRENAHRAMMICYAQMGEKKRIQAHLDQLRLLLRQELDTDPSQETLGLAHLLLSA